MSGHKTNYTVFVLKHHKEASIIKCSAVLGLQYRFFKYLKYIMLRQPKIYFLFSYFSIYYTALHVGLQVMQVKFVFLAKKKKKKPA